MIKQIKRMHFAILIIALLLTAIGCSKKEPMQETEAKTYQDGIFFAQEDNFSSNGWKYMVTIEVKNGKIVSVDWNGANINGGDPKKTVSIDGRYNMVAYGNAQAEWHEQAEKVEAYLLKTQNPTAITYKSDEGHTDDIAGATIHVIEFFTLAEKALNAGPVGKGPYKDGHYFAVESEFSSNGWRYSVDLTTVNGNIVAVNWNGANRNGGLDKKTSSSTGAYGMVAYGDAQSEWHVQAIAAQDYLLETQDPASISYKDDEGHTDDIAGVSIHVIEFFELAEKALAGDPVPVGSYADGHYYIEADEFASNGWKSTVDLTVYNGRIMAANWNGVNQAGEDKKTVSGEGAYGMLANGGAQSEWHVQAMAAEDYLMETQDPSAITYSDNEGRTDAISGVSIHVSEFFEMAQKALDAGPVKEE